MQAHQRNVKGRPSPKWAFNEAYDIMDGLEPDKVYLHRRRLITTPWFAVNIHRIYLPDRGRDPHDHPFWFVTIPLRGWYNETVWKMIGGTRSPYTQRIHRRFRPMVLRLGRAHQIDAVSKDLVTLFIHGPRKPSWGFWTRHGHVDWKDYDAYLIEHGLTPS